MDWNSVCREAALKYPDNDAAIAFIDETIRKENSLYRHQRNMAWVTHRRGGLSDARYEILLASKENAGADPPAEQKMSRAGMAALNEAIRPLLDAFTLPDGRTLRSLAASDVSVWAENEETKAKGLAHNVRFLEAVAAILPDESSVVGDYLGDAEATKLWQETSE